MTKKNTAPAAGRSKLRRSFGWGASLESSVPPPEPSRPSGSNVRPPRSRGGIVHKPDPTYHLNGGFKPTTKRRADLDGPDFFPTPAWATQALVENERFDGGIWECACGDGAMARVLEEAGYKVRATDLYARGYGETGVDFLNAKRPADNIVTNPPYNVAEAFVAQGLKFARRKFALLLRLAFLEGANRANTIFLKHPPSRVWIFSERITFYMKGAKQAGSGTTAYAWFVWDKAAKAGTELHWFKPGYKNGRVRSGELSNEAVASCSSVRLSFAKRKRGESLASDT